MRRTKEEAAQTREAIIDAAEELFIERGYESTSLTDIANSAGITRGAVHWHFQNKEGLLKAIRERIELPLEQLTELLSSNDLVDPLEALADTIGSILHKYQSDIRLRQLTRLLLQYELNRENSESDEKSMEHHAREVVTEVLVRAQRKSPFPVHWTPESGALAFVGLVSGLLSEWVRGNTDYELVPQVENVVCSVLTTWGAELSGLPETSKKSVNE
ncbi:TetR family transcriptional regulator [Thalassorhabdus alkalitolerans]|uniref:TetR family transcriptional regulator n=1 Tax=Thalassorhabdus alkalitolerans TaxID=2282697 RepID=A0ABW0YQH2_9BACI|nr:TetR family transcriptional regulator [Thalassobacillus sp. C254]